MLCYQIRRAFSFSGEGDDAPETSCLTPYSQHVYFKPRQLTNLLRVDEMLSLSPIIQLKVEDLAREDTSQLYCVCFPLSLS